MASKTPSRRPQDRPRRLQEPPRRLQEPPRCRQDTPVGHQKDDFFTGFESLGLLGAILAQRGLLDAPNNLQDASKTPPRRFPGPPGRVPSKMRPRASKTPPRANQIGLLQKPPADAVAVNQGWSGGGSPAQGVFDPPDHVGESKACSGQRI